MSQVILFSTPSCSWCKRVKRYLKENRVRFKEVNKDGIGGPTGCNYFGSNSAVIERSFIRCAEG